MNAAASLLLWFRGWHRGYKFAVLLIAAWAPFLLSDSPMLTSVIMGAATILFFVVTGPKDAIRDAESSQERESRGRES